jgi:hypothetical protein
MQGQEKDWATQKPGCEGIKDSTICFEVLQQRSRDHEAAVMQSVGCC